MVLASFGIVFLAVYAASAVILYLAEGHGSAYYIKAFVMLLICLALYFLAAFFVSRRITELFGPLDRIAYGLIRDEQFIENGEKDIKGLADSLKAQSEQMSMLSKELESAQSNLDDVFTASRNQEDQQQELLKMVVQDLERLRKRQEDAALAESRMAAQLAEAAPMEGSLRKKRDALYEQMQQMEEAIHAYVRRQEDAGTEFRETDSAYELLASMHAEAEELVGSIYNEMTALQSLATQVNLYAMNTSLDIARAGSITVSAISALDEIKELTGKMSAKTDDVLLFLIRTRNALKLAVDQIGECREKGAECSQSLEQGKDALNGLQESIGTLLAAGTSLSDDAARLSAALYEADLLQKRSREDHVKAAADTEKLKTNLKSWII
ncbi:MAG: hypothetical protein IJ600_11365 [Lachnospiraceae bacterium]|nr:hypothetical protein [Lachnospiraceae bacterium]